VWHAWLTKGRAQDRRSGAGRLKAVKWVTIAGLLAAAALWTQFIPHEAVSGALALLCNPVAHNG